MNQTILPILVTLSIVTLNCVAELQGVAKEFVSAATTGDSAKLTEVYLEGPTRERSVAVFMEEALPQINAKKLTVAPVDKELVIGDLGVTLIRLDFAGHPEPNFQPLICVRTEAGWRVFPWASQADLKVLVEQRSPDEQIHLKLFNTWANLVEEQLTNVAEQGGAGEPATRAESESEGSDKPQTESERRSR